MTWAGNRSAFVKRILVLFIVAVALNYPWEVAQAVDFLFGSDFKWILLLFTSPWVLSLWLFQRENRSTLTETA